MRSLALPHWQLNDELPSLMIAKLDHLGLMQISGEDKRKFMQGQVTSDINTQDDKTWCWGAHCDPKGKMLANFRSFFFQDDIFLLMPKSTVEQDLPQLQKYAVFNKVELANATDNWVLLGIAGNKATDFINKNISKIENNVTEFTNGIIIRDLSNSEHARYILLLSPEAAQNLLTKTNEQLFEHSAWQALEIASGYPNISATYSGQYIPQMCNLQALNGISFTKGCYMGQETVARIKYRGGNKRALFVLSGSSEKTIDAETQVEIALENDNYRKAGNIIEFVQRNNQVLLTAVLANDIQVDAKLRLSCDETSTLRIQPLPYSLEE